MSVAVILENGFHFSANVHTFAATRVEFASLGGIGGRGNIPLQNDPFHLKIGVRHRNGREQRLRVGMHGIGEQIALFSLFVHVPEVHDAHFVGNVFDDRQIVRNKDICKIILLLQIFEQIYDLRLNGNVQRGNGLVAYDQFGF